MMSSENDHFPVDNDDTETISFDWTDVGRPSVGVIEAVAMATKRDALCLPPLNDVIDGDALDALVSSARRTDQEDFRLSIVYDGCEIVMDRTGGVVSAPSTGA